MPDIPTTYDPGPEMPLGNDSADVTRRKFEAAARHPDSGRNNGAREALDYIAEKRTDSGRHTRAPAETPKIVRRESGPRDEIVCVLPLQVCREDPLGGPSVTCRHAHETLRGRLCEIAGGFTASDVTGYWKDPETGQVEAEPGLRYSVSFPRDAHAIMTGFALEEAFIACAAATGQKWVHLEWHGEAFSARHAEIAR